MDLKVTVHDVTKENRKEKLFTLEKALWDSVGLERGEGKIDGYVCGCDKALPAHAPAGVVFGDGQKVSKEANSFLNVNTDKTEKAHKYIRRWKTQEGFAYENPTNQSKTSVRRSEKEIIKSAPIIDGEIVENKSDIELAITNLQKLSDKNKLVRHKLMAVFDANDFKKHLYTPKGDRRNNFDLLERTKYLQFIPNIWARGALLRKDVRKDGVFFAFVANCRVDGKVTPIELDTLAIGGKKRKIISVHKIQKAIDNDSFCRQLQGVPKVPASIEPLYKKCHTSIKRYPSPTNTILDKPPVVNKSFPTPSSVGDVFGDRQKVSENASTWKYISHKEKIAQALIAFDNPKDTMLFVPYTREEYNRLFVRGKVETPLGEVKLGEHQFERLDTKDNKDKGARRKYLGAMWQTLKSPTCVIEEVDKKGRSAKVFIKTFKGTDKNSVTLSVVPTFDNINVQVSFGLRKTKDVRKKIETASSVLFVNGGGQTNGTGDNPLPVTNILPNSFQKSTLLMTIHDVNADKIEKAITSAHLLLSVPQGAPKGEGFVYHLQKELTNRWCAKLSGAVADLYNKVCEALGLPKMTAVQKAFPFISPLGTVFKNRQKVKECPSEWVYISQEKSQKLALDAFDNPKDAMLFVPYTRDKYNELFPEGKVTNFFETVKLGEHQFERLAAKDNEEKGARKNYIGAMWQTLKKPTCIIDDIDKQGRHAKLYIKSFTDKKPTVAVIATIDGMAVSVSFGLRKSNSMCNKIKTASIIYYVDGGGQTNGHNDKSLPADSIIPKWDNLSSIKRVFQKSITDSTGHILYSPETGEPITSKEWNAFKKELQRQVDMHFQKTGERIVLDAETLGRILDKMGRYQTKGQIDKLRLDKLTYEKHRYDWISDSVKNLETALGEELTYAEKVRIMTMQASAAQRITKVSDNLRNDIQQLLIDGVKNRQSKSQISQQLFDKMVGHTRDFLRVADTEAQRALNDGIVQGALHSAKKGEKVYFQRIEIIDDNTCKACKTLNGKIALWAEDESALEADDKADLIINDTSEKRSTLHPYCRGVWERV